MPQLQSGMLIAIEGIDGSGKTTLAHTLSVSLEKQGYSIMLTKEPGDSALGKEIRNLVCTQNIPICPLAQYLLFAADRAQHFTERIIPALAQRKIIICDRLSDSSLAYQSYGNGVSTEIITPINQWSMQNTPIDLTIFVRIPIEVALGRCKTRGALSAYEKKDFLQRVADGFEEIYKNRTDVILVDGTLSPQEMATHSMAKLQQWISNKTAQTVTIE
jgi:dTMP kinase